ncbi:MAG: AAC(3) family N-acetyltransferase [Bacteroidota bacterium]
MRDLKIIGNTLRYNYLMRKRKKSNVSDPADFLQVLDYYRKDPVVFIHAGLSQIKQAFAVDPYSFLMESLTERFQGIIAPGFTPSFRTTGLYHKEFSRPEYGKFSWLFHQDASFRSDDPIHSLLVRGEYGFQNSYTPETFGPGSCFDQLDRENILCLSIGTQWPISSQKHYVEYRSDLPYIRKVQYQGVIYFDKQQYRNISVVNYVRTHWFNKYLTLMWNNYKIARQMQKRGIMQIYDLNGLMVYAFRLQDLRRFSDEKFIHDPYYLFT